MTAAALPTIARAAKAMRRREVSAAELTRWHLARIAALGPQLDAYLAVTADRAMAAAERADRDFAAGRDRGALQGIPYALKDIFDVAGLATTCHSRLRAGHVAGADAPVVGRLEAAGAVLLGKTALHEFAVGGPAFDLPFPPARNPWHLGHHPGGSSSGSGAAVAAGLAMAALGTDTGGSVRNPATCCGIVGLKPTYDLVDRRGAFPLSFSLDHVGPLTRTVEDNAIVLDAVVEPQRSAGGHGAGLGAPIAGLKIGTLEQFHEDAGDVDPDVEHGFAVALAALRDLGARLVRVAEPPLREFQWCGRVIQQAESHAIHRHWLSERPQDYCGLSREKLSAGGLIGAADFVAAQQARRVLSDRLSEATRGLDAVVALSSFTTPRRLDDPAAIAATYERHARMPFNVTGWPALALPVGFSHAGLPLGIQLAAPPYQETMLFRIGHALEQALGVAGRVPPGFAGAPAVGRADAPLGIA